MQGPGESAVSDGQMQLLLVGKNKDFSYLRDLLSQSGNGHLGLDYTDSTEDALARLSKTNYDLLICEYESGDGAALRLMHELRRNGPGAPVIFLSDHMNEAAIDAALKTGTVRPDSRLNSRRAVSHAHHPPCHRRLRQGASAPKDGGYASQTLAGG